MSNLPLVPQYIRDLANYVPGKTIDEVKREYSLNKIIKLASNENSLGPSPRAMEAMRQAMSNVNRYPDSSGYLLRKKLSDRFNVTLDNVVLGAGSEGIMATILRTFLLNDDEIITASGSFIGFRVLANATGRKIHWVDMKNHRYDLEAIAAKINKFTKIIYIANPDNPMGTFITREEFETFYNQVPERVLIILDEAYFEFTSDRDQFPDSMTYRYDNVITLRTFSKAYGLAGLRIGYGFAHDELIRNLLKVKVPFEPSYLAQVAGFTALDDFDFLQETISFIRKGKKYYQKELKKLQIKTNPSATNFITTIWESEEQATSVNKQMLEKGVILRHLSAFGWPDCIRISIGLPEENKKCIDTLKTVL